jgi:hypothetical protein
MEIIQVQPKESSHFIKANTIEMSYNELKHKHVIPVFSKSNEPAISHTEFVDVLADTVHECFKGESILSPSFRVSHPMKGRIPSAKDKPAKELLESEKTLYYERAFTAIEIESINDHINGEKLSLVVGGIKAFNQDNLYNKKGVDEHFQVFIGFKNFVCTNLCVSTDGFKGVFKVKNLEQLYYAIKDLIEAYSAIDHIRQLEVFLDWSLTEHEFAQLIGRCRLYQHLDGNARKALPTLLLSDSQINSVVKGYYTNKHHKASQGQIGMWELYNLFTHALKSSYIDNIASRLANSHAFITGITESKANDRPNWFLS